MIPSEEWFRQYGRLNHTISDNGYRYELVTNEFVFHGVDYAINREIALLDLLNDVEHELWITCHRMEAGKCKQ